MKTITCTLQVRENKSLSPSPDDFTAPNSTSVRESMERLLAWARGGSPSTLPGARRPRALQGER